MLLNRKGEVEHVVVGNAHKLELPDIGRARAGQVRLRGLRLVHTHLKCEPLTKDDLTDLALLRLDLVAAIGRARRTACPGVLHYAHLRPGERRRRAAGAPRPCPRVHDDAAGRARPRSSALEEELAAGAPRAQGRRPRAGHPGGGVPGRQPRRAPRPSLAELEELARTAGVEVLDAVLQMRREADPRYLIGRGKLEDLNLRSMQPMADVLIFDKDLTPVAGPPHRRGDQPQGPRPHPAHPRHLRPARAERRRQAPGRAGAAQVPAAAAGRRATTRSRGSPAASAGAAPARRSSRSTAAACATASRTWRSASTQLSRERQVRRAQRNRRELPVISIVGYTNAGKSTLLNALTNAEVLAENKLFATLDPTSRRLRFPAGARGDHHRHATGISQRPARVACSSWG